MRLAPKHFRFNPERFQNFIRKGLGFKYEQWFYNTYQMFVLSDAEVDTRALAAFRIGMGLLLIADVLLRLRNFWYFYTDEGVVPYGVVSNDVSTFATASFPIWELSTHPVFTFAVFLAAFIVGVFLVVGYKTRLMTVLAFLVVSAIDARNPYVLSYADVVFHLLLLWAMFLPLGERWSLDAIRRNRDPRGTVASIASAFILAQMVLMYIGNGSRKILPDYYWSSDVLGVLLTLDHVTYSHAQFINGFDGVLAVLTYVWLGMMLASPILFFLRGYKRALFASAFIGAHISMAATLRIGAFPYVAVTALLLFIPPVVWDDLSEIAMMDGRVADVYNWFTEKGTIIVGVVEPFEPPVETQVKIRSITVKCFIGGFLVASLLLIGIAGGVVDSERNATEYVDETIDVFGLAQPSWNFYASNPPYYDKYYVIAGNTTAGTEVDIYNDRPLTFDRPHSGSSLNAQYERTYRERFYMTSVSRSNETEIHNQLRDGLVTYYCENYQYNGEGLANASFYQVEEEITPENRLDRELQDTERTYFGTYDCEQ